MDYIYNTTHVVSLLMASTEASYALFLLPLDKISAI